jgi:Cu-Zn family superoxide dismutase
MYNSQPPFKYLYPYRTGVKKLAIANLRGSKEYPSINGIITFEDVANGAYVTTEIFGLPEYKKASNKSPQIGPHGFHIHEYGNCDEENSENPFSNAGGHYNPYDQPHGNHAGDFPVVFSNNGYARMSFFTNKFSIKDIIGRSVIVHENPDDYQTQPSGGAGKRIACGIIYETNNIYQ